MTSLEELAEKLPGAKRYERYLAARCPFHTDNSPSMLVYEDGFRCLACGEHGSIRRLLERLSVKPLVPQVSRPGYLPEIPADWDNARLARSAHNLLVETPGLQQYLIGRGLERAIERFDLGYWDGWYTVPVRDSLGITQQIVFRAGPWVQKETGTRFWQRSGQKPMLYLPEPPSLIDRVLFVTYGIFDAITISLLGYPCATSTNGKGVFHPEWLDWWEGPVVIVPDLLEETNAFRLAAQLGWRGNVWIPAYPENCKDPNDLLKSDEYSLPVALYETRRNFTDRFWVDGNGALLPRRRAGSGTGSALRQIGLVQAGGQI